jgi:hypothetical protein
MDLGHRKSRNLTILRLKINVIAVQYHNYLLITFYHRKGDSKLFGNDYALFISVRIGSVLDPDSEGYAYLLQCIKSPVQFVMSNKMSTFQ